MPSSTTDAETIALKALGDVSKIQDKTLYICLPGRAQKDTPEDSDESQVEI
jgi:hypothetical protein